MNPVVRGDILVSDFLDSVGGYRHKERRDHLLDILDVDLDWRMHQISDGALYCNIEVGRKRSYPFIVAQLRREEKSTIVYGSYVTMGRASSGRGDYLVIY